MQYPDARLLVFAKAPQENQVKTRLIPHIGSHNATHLYQLMMLQTLNMAVDSNLCPVQLWCSPNAEHEIFEQIGQHLPLQLFNQSGDDLGERMYRAACQVLQAGNSAVIIGCDCLQLTVAHLQAVFDQLHNGDNDVVIVPATDGGYVLIGLRKLDRCLFQDIAWSSDKVMEQTRTALGKLQWSWQETTPLRDVDTMEDLADVVNHPLCYQLDPQLEVFIQQIAGLATQELGK